MDKLYITQRSSQRSAKTSDKSSTCKPISNKSIHVRNWQHLLKFFLEIM